MNKEVQSQPNEAQKPKKQSLRMQQLTGQTKTKADASPVPIIAAVWILFGCQFILPLPIINPWGLIMAGTIFCIRLIMHPKPVAKINGLIVLVLQFLPFVLIVLKG
ncbi:MAG: hypothetical protein JXB13_15485 [Phycisphaerae bacterium]|nr:hypothetical protein [Phycisphaerae bacterium]